MKRTTLAALCGAGLLAASAMARAQDEPRRYLALAVGQSQMRNACAGAPSGLTCDDSDTAFRLAFGYELVPHVAIEAGYAVLGTAHASSGETADLSALDLSVIGSWPLGNRFAMHGRFGVYHGETELTSMPPAVPATFPPPPQPPQVGWQTGGNNDLTFGLGASYRFASTAAFRLEWQRYNKLGGGGPSISVDLISLGALFHF